MIKNAVQMIRENYDRLGDLTDGQFIAAKSRACSKRLIHAERIVDVQLIDSFAGNRSIKVSQIEADTTVRIKATVRNMASETEKTGFVTLEDIKDVQFDEKTGVLVIENDKYIITTLNCQKEMADLEAVIRGDNWVNIHSLGELIGNETILSDFKMVRDDRGGRDLELNDLGFVEDVEMPDLLF